MGRLPLPDDCVLARTADGTRKMRSHAADITPKLRSVLFLIDGVQPVRKLLDRAGELRPLLEAQLIELLQRGLVEANHQAPRNAGSPSMAPPQGTLSLLAHRTPPAPSVSGVPAIVGAKMQLLAQLESLAGESLCQYSATLVEARTWPDLARRAKEVARVLENRGGCPEAAAIFWARAKEILVTWRGKNSIPVQP